MNGRLWSKVSGYWLAGRRKGRSKCGNSRCRLHAGRYGCGSCRCGGDSGGRAGDGSWDGGRDTGCEGGWRLGWYSDDSSDARDSQRLQLLQLLLRLRTLRCLLNSCHLHCRRLLPRRLLLCSLCSLCGMQRCEARHDWLRLIGSKAELLCVCGLRGVQLLQVGRDDTKHRLRCRHAGLARNGRRSIEAVGRRTCGRRIM